MVWRPPRVHFGAGRIQWGAPEIERKRESSVVHGLFRITNLLRLNEKGKNNIKKKQPWKRPVEVSLWETVKGVAADIVQQEHNYLKGNKSERFFLDRKMSLVATN